MNISNPTQAAVYGPPADFFIVEPGERHPYSYSRTYAGAEAALHGLRANNPTRFARASIEVADRVIAQIERSYLDQRPRLVSLDDFHEALDVLPPRHWVTVAGIERFNMAEFTHGRITTQYARRGETCAMKYVADGDHSTYFTHADFDHCISAAD